jgi:hypothetical protein
MKQVFRFTKKNSVDVVSAPTRGKSRMVVSRILADDDDRDEAEGLNSLCFPHYCAKKGVSIFLYITITIKCFMLREDKIFY